MRSTVRSTRGIHRSLGKVTTTVALVPAVVLVLVVGVAAVAVAEDDDGTPTQAEVDAARQAARAKARDVAAVQADLVLANQRLQTVAISAARAAEAYNGAVWRLGQAREKARAAEAWARRSQRAVARQQRAYGDVLATSYASASQLSAMAAILDADGARGVMERYTTLRNAESALDGRYDEFRAFSTLADLASRQAAQARAEAERLEREMRAARDAARSAADAAAAEAEAVAVEKASLIRELARLQDISVSLAEERQADLEARAAERAAEAAAVAAQQAAQEAEQEQPSQDQAQHEQPGQQQGGGSGGQPAQQQPAAPPQEPVQEPDPSPPPADASGAERAIGFARAQLGEPYEWGAAGPDSWDCSGLTMQAWAAGGRSLPHYSVAQYEQSTPISASALRAGDLVFWGSSYRPSSIYHVALYIGDGQIIHAPRTGRPVTIDSMYYWIPPNFFARP